MAYDTKDLEKRALKAIDKHKLFFVTDIPAMIGISTAAFYDHKLEKSEKIKDALLANRVAVKSSMRSKWYQSENPTLQIGLYKLIGNEDEYHRLANTKIDVTTREEQPIFNGIDLNVNTNNSPSEDNEAKEEG